VIVGMTLIWIINITGPAPARGGSMFAGTAVSPF
jgi:hypothetical protein